MVALVAAASSIWGYQQKTHIANLTKELNETEQERVRYTKILQQQQMPAPTSFTKYDKILKEFAPQQKPSEQSYKLDCIEKNGGGFRFADSLNLNSDEIVVLECLNQELAQVVFLVEILTSNNGNDEAQYSKILLHNLVTRENNILFKNESDSEFDMATCSYEFNWFRNGWIYFECERIPSGIKGDYYPGPSQRFGYYYGSSEMRRHGVYLIESCAQPYAFEELLDTQKTCTSLCSSDSDCQINHFCDLSQKKEYGICVKKCSSSLQCSPDSCVAYEGETTLKPKELKSEYAKRDVYPVTILGCEY